MEKRKSKDQIQSVELEEREGWIKGKLSEEISWQEEEEASREAAASEDDRAGKVEEQASVSSPNYREKKGFDVKNLETEATKPSLSPLICQKTPLLERKPDARTQTATHGTVLGSKSPFFLFPQSFFAAVLTIPAVVALFVFPEIKIILHVVN